MKKAQDIIVLAGIAIILILGIVCCVNSININKRVKSVEEDVKKIKNEIVWEENEEDIEDYYDDEYYYEDEEESEDGEYEEPEFDEETEETEQTEQTEE